MQAQASNKRVLVTGAASGIGRAVAERFAAEGFDVCALDLQDEKLSELLISLPKGDHFAVAGSFAEEEIMETARELIANKWGSLDVLINCAGIFEKTDLNRMKIEEWRKVFDIMVDGCLRTTKLSLEFMNSGGRIVHISSIHGGRAELSAGAYSTAKAAINQFCRAMAVELAPQNILVNAIAPGFVDTAMSVVDGMNELESEWFKENYVNSHHLPLKRAAKASEIAGVAWFLANNDASYITGQVITVDGGLTITF